MRSRVAALLGRLSVVMACMLAAVAFGASPAFAHAGLESSTPAASSVLEESPAQIVLDFDETVESALASIEVFDADRRPLAMGEARRGGDGTIVTADVPDLADGTYVVVWRVVSTDGHTVEGAFSFQVGSASTTDAAALVEAIRAGATASGAVSTAAVVMRLIGYLGLVVVVGAGVFVLVSPSRLAEAAATRRLLVGAGVAFAAGTVLQTGLQAADATGGGLLDAVRPGAWGDYLATRTGQTMFARIAAAAVLLAVVVGARRRDRVWWSTAALVAALVGVVSFPLAGHPSVASPPVLWVTVDAVHLVAVSVWLGGLVLFTAGGRVWRHDPEAAGVLSGFSSAAGVAVPLIVVTGVFQSIELAGGVDALRAATTDTTWGRLLLVKVVLVVVLLVVGAVSRWALRRSGRAAVMRTVVSEAALGVVVLALVAVIVAQPPQPPVPSKVTQVTLTQAGLLAEVTVTPGRVGSNEVHVVVTPAGGSLTPVVGVEARMSLAALDLPDVPVELGPLGPDHYTGTVTLPFSGDWTLELIVEPTPGSVLLLSTSVTVP